MLRSKNRVLAASILALSLSGLVGCASPMPTVAPATTSDVGGAPAATPAAPAQAGAQPAAPAQPAAAAAAQTFTGTASFRGEPEAGLSLKAYDAFSGQELTVGGAPSSNGVALSALSATTGAQGEFSLTVAGLDAGQAVKLVGTKAGANFSALVTAQGGYKVQQAAVTVQLDELTTALAHLSDGVLRTFGATGAKGSADALALAAKIDALGAKLVAAFKANPNLANGVVAGDDEKARESSLGQLLDNAGAKDALKDVVGQAVSLLNKADASTLKPESIAFTGLDLKLNIQDAKLTLTNGAGRTVDAKNGVDSVKEATKNETNHGSSDPLSGLRNAAIAANTALQNAQTAYTNARQPAQTAYDNAVNALNQAQANLTAAQTEQNTASMMATMAMNNYMMCTMSGMGGMGGTPPDCSSQAAAQTEANTRLTNANNALPLATAAVTTANQAVGETETALGMAGQAESSALDTARSAYSSALDLYFQGGGNPDDLPFQVIL